MNIAVIGAGAAGLMAAARAAIAARQAGIACRVVVLEKNRKAGVKILMSGGTRCNLTHDCGPAGIMEAFGKGGQFLRQALAALPPSQVVALFHSLGVPTQIEATGKIFPSSNRALDVRDALLGYAERSGAEVRLATPVRGIVPEPAGDGIVVSTDEAQEKFDAVIVTAGADSIPPALVEQLRTGGRLVIPVDTGWGQDLRVCIKEADGSLRERTVLPVIFVPLVGRR